MARWILAVTLAFTASVAAADLAGEAAIEALLLRRIPELLPYLELQLEAGSDAGGREFFEVGNSTTSGLNVSITASSTSSLALGVHYYLKYVANRHISWYVSNLRTVEIPPPLPQKTERYVVDATWRYAWNVCTHGYSMAWWGWERWELELDFMALQGVNLPLLFTGQEYIWSRVFKQFGVSDDDLSVFYSSSAFLPWQRMGNEAGWGGPLSLAKQVAAHATQIQILRRAAELGMTAVLPCFGGNVPRSFGNLHPNSSVTPYPLWNNFPNESALLDPTDEMFVKLGKAFASEQRSVHGGWCVATKSNVQLRRLDE